MLDQAREHGEMGCRPAPLDPAITVPAAAITALPAPTDAEATMTVQDTVGAAMTAIARRVCMAAPMGAAAGTIVGTITTTISGDSVSGMRRGQTNRARSARANF